MSYTRRFNKTVAVDYSGSVTVYYPASKSGGTITKNYDGVAYEDVTVEIEVDTDPFDISVANCNDNVNNLTMSVGAMNAAQCAAIAENANKVSKAIIDGFFSSVKTDLATQKAELEQVVESRLLLLRQQAASLKEIQKTMGDDYARTTARYQKIFTDLNNELSIRIHEVDQPVFNMVNNVDQQSDRMIHTDMIQTAVTMGKESGLLQAQVGMATVKNHALEAMGRAQAFLTSKAMSERTIQQTTIDGNGHDKYFVPVCFMKTVSENNQVEQQCVLPEYYDSKDPNLKTRLSDQLEGIVPENDGAITDEQLKSYIQSEIGSRVVDNDEHSIRVRDLINKMLNK